MAADIDKNVRKDTQSENEAMTNMRARNTEDAVEPDYHVQDTGVNATQDELAHRLDSLLKNVLPHISDQQVGSAVAAINRSMDLFPEESALIAHSGSQRKIEFSSGRHCARRALVDLGCQWVPILMGSLYEPIWPLCFSGSISHNGRLAAALAYRSQQNHVSLSIDLIDLTDSKAYFEVGDIVHHPAEPCLTDGRAIARLFSAKETAIKIISPEIRDFVDFKALRAVKEKQGFRVFAEKTGHIIKVYTFELGEFIVSLGSKQNVKCPTNELSI